MRDIFLELLNRSITAGWLILAIIALRLALRKAPRWISCLLWGLAAFRLICPVSLESIFSIIPSRETVRPDIVRSPSPAIDSGVKAVDNIVNPVLKQTFTPETGAAVNPLQIALTIAGAVWILGLVVMISYALGGYVRLRLRVRTAVRLTEPVYVSEFVDTPFILGLFSPRIYLPAGMPEEMQAAVLAHERAHLKRRDHLWKALGYGLLAVYWFHPLCWAAYILFCRDVELACDERAIRDFEPVQRKSYSEALLFCSVSGGHLAAACPLAFGEIGVKERIRSVLRYRKPAIWIIAAALVACVIVGVCFLTDPVKAGQKPAQGDGRGSAEGNISSSGQDESDPAGNPGGAGQEDGSESTGNNGQEEMSPQERLTAFLRQWTAAFVNRDGEKIAALASEETVADLKERELLLGSAGSYSLGESSPWPLDPEADVWVIGRGEGTAKINYYAWTSECYAVVWTERLSYEDRDGTYVVTGEELTWHDVISTAEQYQEAYPVIDGTRMDYMTNGAGQWILENALTDSTMLYYPLYEPESAVVRLLNLTEDPREMTVERLWENGDMVGLNLTFLQGEEHSFRINMRHMGGMFWVPQNAYMNPVFWLQQVDWDAVKRKNISVGEGLSEEGVRCIARIPEEGITLYGADDPECGNGVMVELGRERFFYDWIYTSPRDILPECYWDKNGRQLQVALGIYTGTGADSQELHVLQYHDGKLTDNTLDLNGYSELLYGRIQFTYDQETSRITLNDSKHGTELATREIEGPVEDLELGSISHFLLGEKLYLQVQTGYFMGVGFGVAEYDDMPVLVAEVLMKETGSGSILFELGEIRVAEE